jgi:hypothetical protein
MNVKSRAAVWSFVSVLVVLFVAAGAVAQQPALNTIAVVPQLIPYSGVAKDVSGKPLSGVVGITFLLYQQEQGGAPLWLETQNVQADSRGNYSVQLGATLANGLPSDLFVTGEARWLGVQISGQAESARVMLLSVPYALKAGDAQTIGGLPPSAFVLAAAGAVTSSASSSNPTATVSSSTAPPASSNVTTTGGTVNAVPLWTTSTNIQNSALTQTGSGATAKIGINTTKPAATLDVSGTTNVRGLFTLPSAGTATSTAGKNSQAIDLVSSAFNSGTNTAVNQTFQWQAEPVGNNTGNATGSLNLLFGSGTNKPSETGLNIASNGQITFAKGQTFPGSGTITGVTTASGSGLTGGATSGNVTLNVDPTQVPYLNAANTFTDNQTVNGNLSSTGVLTASSYQIGSNLFAFGSYAFGNAFLGFAGNTGTTGGNNTASGVYAFFSNTTGSFNTATGDTALYSNTTGIGNTANGAVALVNNTIGGGNTADGDGALQSNTTGSSNTADGAGALASTTTGGSNTASGYDALLTNTTGSNNVALGYAAGYSSNSAKTTGSNDTFIGYGANAGTQVNLNNATAIGADAQVTTNNSLVLGSINGVNGATASTNVGIGTTAPASTLDVHGTGNFTGLITFASGQTFPGTGTITGVTPGTALTGGGSSGAVTLNVDTTKVVTGITAGTDLTGGGTGGVQTINLDTTKVPQLNAANTFTGNQTVNGNVTATGPVTGSSYQIGSNLFASGSFANANAFMGFAGNASSGNTGNNNTASGSLALSSNTTGADNTANGSVALRFNTTGNENTASGVAALGLNSTGNDNAASGVLALGSNNTGNNNTASGTFALFSNTTGANNTASGWEALSYNSTGSGNTGLGLGAGDSTNNSLTTGSNNTYLGFNSNSGTQVALNNASAIGANSQVTASNAMVLGSINNVNFASASTNVGIGTTAPTYLLHLGNSDAGINKFLRVEGPAVSGTNGQAASFGGFGTFGIDAPGTVNGRFVVKDTTGYVGIGTAAPAFPLDVQTPNGQSYDPVARFGSSGATDSNGLLVRNGAIGGTANAEIFVAGAAGAFVPGTIAGDGGLRVEAHDANIFFGDATLARMKIDTSGNVTISGNLTQLSDRNAKANFSPVDGPALLEKLAAIPILQWNYKTQSPAIRHLGPMAQDFRAAFGLGDDEKHISTLDESGVALAAIQELYRIGHDKDERIQKQQVYIRRQQAQLNLLREKDAQQTRAVKAVAAQMSLLQAKLAQVENNINELKLAKKTAPANARHYKATVVASTDGSGGGVASARQRSEK